MGKVIIKIKDVPGGLEGAPLWITTFVDMTSLLVTFFILLFTFSAIQDASFSRQLDLIGTSGVLGKEDARDLFAPEDDIMQAKDVRRGARHPHARPADELLQNVEEMGQRLTEEHVQVQLKDAATGLRIVFPERAGFAPGAAYVNDPLRKSLREMGETMRHYRHAVLIEGFTDDAFAPTPEHPTAESLSLARAAAAARVLLEESGLAPELVQVAGRGSVSPRSDAADGALGRRADRRVEVVIIAMDRARAKLYEEEVGR